MDRFDFARKDTGYPNMPPDHFNFTTMWPHAGQSLGENQEHREALWAAYAEYLHSFRMVAMEQIYNVKILQEWCRSRNAKLIISPAYDASYDRDYWLRMGLEEEYVNLFPWHLIFKAGGFDTWINLVEAQEGLRKNSYYDYMKVGSPKGFITPCAHPSKTGHRQFAKALHEHIKNGL